MSQEIVERTQKTAELYFKDVTDERPFDLWRSFDKGLARDFSLFITGQMYAREKIPHQTRQLITVAALTVLSRLDELRLHIQAALNVGCSPEEIGEVIFQTAVYGGVPATNAALKTLRSVLKEKGLWPPAAEDKSQKTEDRGQRTEDRSRKSDVRSQKPEGR